MIEKLIKIQSELKAPKNQNNKFGKYKYRSCEDILSACNLFCRSAICCAVDLLILQPPHTPTSFPFRLFQNEFYIIPKFPFQKPLFLTLTTKECL